VEGPDYDYKLIIKRVDLPPEVGVAWAEGPDAHTTVMLFPRSEITERGARLLEEASRRRRWELVQQAGGRQPWEVEAERQQRQGGD
jgi:hypothetical protein